MGIHLPEGDFTPSPTSDGMGCLIFAPVLIVVLISWLFCIFIAAAFLIDAWILWPLGKELINDGTLLPYSINDITTPELRLECTISCISGLFLMLIPPFLIFAIWKNIAKENK